MCEEYFESEEYKKNQLKLHEASMEKYRVYLPVAGSNALTSYIHQWAELHTYLVDNYSACTTDETKRLFFKEFFRIKYEISNVQNNWLIDDLKNLLSFCEETTEIYFFKEFIDEILKKHSDWDSSYTIEQYFCKHHNYEIYNYYLKKMNESKTDYEKMMITRRFIDEKKCLSRPMNIEVFLKVRESQKNLVN